MNATYDPIHITLFLATLSLLPMLLITCTAFLKISMVLLIVRNAIGVQQVPANMAIYGIALIMTVFVMAPTFREMTDILAREQPHATESQGAMDNIGKAMEPLRTFMLKHARDDQRERFLEKAKRLWPEDQAANATANDFVVVVPAFMVSEMQAAFEMGFLMYVPFLVIDMIVSNILLALGMQMVSPMTVSLPLKLFIFVVIDGWGRLLDAILNTYL